MVAQKIKKRKNIYIDWEDIIVPTTQKYIYIKKIILPVFDITFTFAKKSQTDEKTSHIFNVIGNLIGTTITSIDEAPIKLKGVCI